MIWKQCIFYDHPCYRSATKMLDGIPAGIVLHSTRLKNPYLRYHIQPSLGDVRREEILLDIGESFRKGYCSCFSGENRPSDCVHAYIGKNAAGTVQVYQTLPLDDCCRGMGEGTCASYDCNPQAHIQISICTGSRQEKSYFRQAWQRAAAFCAFLCAQYGLPQTKICSHREAYWKGFGDCGKDPEDWFAAFGVTMEDFRSEVKTLLAKERKQCGTKLQVGDFVYFSGCRQYKTPYSSAYPIPCKSGMGEVMKIICHPIYTQIHTVYVRTRPGGGLFVNGWVDLEDLYLLGRSP